MKHLLILLLALLGACRSGPPEVPLLATARIADDFETYPLLRIGLLPASFAAGVPDMAREQREELDRILFAEFAGSMAQELLALGPDDLLEIPTSQPLRLGAYEPQTLIRLARSYRLDALLFVNVTAYRAYPPQQIALAAELVAADTGLVIWNAGVHLDASHEPVREALRAFYFDTWKEIQHGPDWRIALVSPSRFATFAAWQLARML